MFVGHSWWEQAAMHHFLNDDVYMGGPLESPTIPTTPLRASTWQLTRRHAQYVPQWWINRYADFGGLISSCASLLLVRPHRSYPPMLASMLQATTGARTGFPLHHVYSAGHFIVSFSGCAVLTGNRTMCHDVFKQYAAAAV